jgi:hypothetical protein
MDKRQGHGRFLSPDFKAEELVRSSGEVDPTICSDWDNGLVHHRPHGGSAHN